MVRSPSTGDRMNDVMSDGRAGSLVQACAEPPFGEALDLLRYGPFSDDRCAPPSPPRGVTWFSVSWLPPSDDELPTPLSTVLRAMVGGHASVHVRVRTDHGTPSLLIGVDGGSTQATYVQRLAAPGMLLEPAATPGDLGGAAVAGLLYRLLPSPTDDPSVAPAPQHSMLGRLLTLPMPSWEVRWTLTPLPTAALDTLLQDLERCEAMVAPHLQLNKQLTATQSVTVTDPQAQRLMRWLDCLHGHASSGRASGMWISTCHALAPNHDMSMLVAALRSAITSDSRRTGDWVASVLQAGAGSSTPPQSLLSTDDVDGMLAPPPASAPGLSVAPALPAARVAVTSRQVIDLGRRLGTDQPFSVGLDDLEGHAFVTGTTGAGKSTTVRQLLAEAWNRHGVPFLVIDPVKADYESVAGEVDGGLLVLDARDLHLNVLCAWPGTDPMLHLEYVAGVFKGSFSMPSPVPYVVTQLFHLLTERVGYAPEPTLHDLRERVDAFVASLGYAGEITANIRASVGARLGVLLAPHRAERVAGAGTAVLEQVLGRPSIVQLGGLGDDEERSFLMSMLALYVAEAARVRGPVGGVAHLTVLEEAHRVLQEPGAMAADPDRGDPSGTSARLLTQLLAEIRSNGESLIVVDQSPNAVAKDVLRNTNLKVAHRIPAAEDREAIAASMGLVEEFSWGLTRLATGQVLVSSRKVPEAQAVQVVPTHSGASRGGRATPASEDAGRECCGGKPAADPHHASEMHAVAAARIMALFVAGSLAGQGDGAALASEVTADLRYLSRQHPDTRVACLAWVGLRRVLEHDVERGLLGGRELATHLASLFAMWRTKQDVVAAASKVRRTKPVTGLPFPTCAACTCQCSFPGSAMSRLGAEPEPGIAAAIAGRASKPRDKACGTWLVAEARRLTPALGEEPARSLALCTLIHAMAGTGIADRIVHKIVTDAYDAQEASSA